MRTWDSYDYKVSTYYLSALINGDDSGLEDGDSDDLIRFEVDAHNAARRDGFIVGHWSCESDDEGDYGTCDVSGLYANIVELKLMVHKET